MSAGGPDVESEISSAWCEYLAGQLSYTPVDETPSRSWLARWQGRLSSDGNTLRSQRITGTLYVLLDSACLLYAAVPLACLSTALGDR